jgi:hypothetical protein
VSPTTEDRSHRHAGRWLTRSIAALLAITCSAVVLVGPAAEVASAAPPPATAEAQFASLLNSARQASGKAPLVVNTAVATTSRTWSATMRSRDAMSHDPNLVANVARVVPDWRRVGENVGVGYDVAQLHNAFMASSGHRANIMGDYNQVGIGVVNSSDGTVWVTLRFVKGSLPSVATRADRVGIRRGASYYLRSTLTSGPATKTFSYGTASDIAVSGDWDGNGTSTPGVFRNGMWYLRNSSTSGVANVSLSFGATGDTPIVGDWNGDGKDSIGTWHDGTVQLRNANSTGSANLTFTYGQTGDVPLVGDWNGDGTDTIGVRRGTTFLLRNSNATGGSSISFSYGVLSDTPLTGDWDGSRTDTVGVRRGNAFYLRNSNTGGNANVSFGYGTASDKVVVGAW